MLSDSTLKLASNDKMYTFVVVVKATTHGGGDKFFLLGGGAKAKLF